MITASRADQSLTYRRLYLARLTAMLLRTAGIDAQADEVQAFVAERWQRGECEPRKMAEAFVAARPGLVGWPP